MSEDPETARQIDALARDTRPLLVLDVDDVLLDFIRPLPGFLRVRGWELRLDDFRLTGNIYDSATNLPADRARVTSLLDNFYADQTNWQTAVDGAQPALASLRHEVEIVLLTAMPHRHRSVRHAHLNSLGFDYPLVTTEMAKGPAIARLRGDSGRPVAFVDDQPRNLASAANAITDVHLFHLTADNSIRAILPPLPDRAIVVDDWGHALPLIRSALKVSNPI